MQHATRSAVVGLESPISPNNAYVSKRERLALAATIRSLLNLVFVLSQEKDLADDVNMGRQNKIIALKQEIMVLKQTLDECGVNDIDFTLLGM